MFKSTSYWAHDIYSDFREQYQIDEKVKSQVEYKVGQRIENRTYVATEQSVKLPIIESLEETC